LREPMWSRSTTNFRTAGFATAQAFNVVFVEVDHWEGLYLVFIANFHSNSGPIRDGAATA